MKERRGSAQAKSPQYDTLPSCNRCQQGSDDQEYGISGRHQKTEKEKNIDGFQLPMRKPSCFQCQSVIHKRVTNISGYNSNKFSQFCTKQTNFSSSAYTSVALKSDTLHRLIVRKWCILWLVSSLMCTCTHACTCTNTQTHTHTHTQACLTHTHTHWHAEQTLTHTHWHTKHTHTHTHTHIGTQIHTHTHLWELLSIQGGTWYKQLQVRAESSDVLHQTKQDVCV